MFRKLVPAAGLVFLVGSVVGCGGSSGAVVTKPSAEKGSMDKLKDGAAAVGDKATELGDKAKQGAKDVAAKAKETVIQPVIDYYPKIEEKIKAMSGDAGETASEKFTELKKLVEEFKTSDKWEGMKDKLLEKFAELKKMVGL